MALNLLNIDALLAPIPGDRPEGQYFPAAERREMQDARKEFLPNPDSPTGEPVARKPDWARQVKSTSEWLTTTSKDLQVALHLVEALTKQFSFNGLREGLVFLQRLFTDCWGRMYPIIEEPSDVEMRTSAVRWLADDGSGANFPVTLRKLPLYRYQKNKDTPAMFVCLDDIKPPPTSGRKPFDAKLLGEARLVDQELPQKITDCLKEWKQLDELLKSKNNDPMLNMNPVRDALNENLGMLNQFGPKTAEATPAMNTPSPDSVGKGSNSSSDGADDQQVTREGVYARLTQLATQLAEMEPHSPIPDLLHWAVKLGNLSFRDLIKEIVREPNVLKDIRRQFGIVEEAKTPPRNDDD